MICCNLARQMNLKMYKLERLDREDALDWDGVEILREI